MSSRNPVITAEALQLSFGRGPARRVAVDGIALRIDRGRWTTVTGPAGAGKTSLLNCLSGLTLPDSGSVQLHPGSHTKDRPMELTRLSENARAKLRRTRIGVIFEEDNLVPAFNIYDNLLLPARLAGAKPRRSEIQAVIERFGLSGDLRQLPRKLSAAQLQRVAFARALLMNPDVVIADDPTGRLDSIAAARLRELLRELVDEQRLTLVLATQNPEITGHSDRVIELLDGRVRRDSAGAVAGQEQTGC